MENRRRSIRRLLLAAHKEQRNVKGRIDGTVESVKTCERPSVDMCVATNSLRRDTMGAFVMVSVMFTMMAVYGVYERFFLK